MTTKDINKEQYDYVYHIITNNYRFSGNEDLLDDFVNETLKRGYNVLQSVSNINNIDSYLKKVANSAILQVLKTSGRVKRTSEGFSSSQESNFTDLAYSVNGNNEIIFDIPDPRADFVQQIVTMDEINTVIKALYTINNQYKEKNFMQLFVLRYIRREKQSKIAQELGISQSEVSKRLIELANKIRDFFG